ncbi:hypothetical protein BJ138DRAFT_1106059 [Hygrophoropsis aurantiaca]|uniref:Uncharacterized protein n=1 Tax=Hygrophoropsis aurantiaca TaxID=72124 RepID=A0ACB7ZW94_9AGAM|nr:hypothetical protein BJ138DRAFT_1106059 [Hygrophoropsis aurantiaca]
MAPICSASGCHRAVSTRTKKASGELYKRCTHSREKSYQAAASSAARNPNNLTHDRGEGPSRLAGRSAPQDQPTLWDRVNQTTRGSGASDAPAEVDSGEAHGEPDGELGEGQAEARMAALEEEISQLKVRRTFLNELIDAMLEKRYIEIRISAKESQLNTLRLNEYE